MCHRGVFPIRDFRPSRILVQSDKVTVMLDRALRDASYAKCRVSIRIVGRLIGCQSQAQNRGYNATRNQIVRSGDLADSLDCRNWMTESSEHLGQGSLDVITCTITAPEVTCGHHGSRLATITMLKPPLHQGIWSSRKAPRAYTKFMRILE